MNDLNKPSKPFQEKNWNLFFTRAQIICKVMQERVCGTPSSNIVELNERITNLLLKQKSDVREDTMIKNGGRRGYHPMPITFSCVFISFLFRVGFTRE